MALLSDQLGEVKNTATPATISGAGAGPAIAEGIRALGSGALKFVRAGFRRDLTEDIKAEMKATGNLQAALAEGKTDDETLFAGLDDKAGAALKGTLRDLTEKAGSLENAVAQGLVSQDLAKSRLDNVVGKAYEKFPGFEADIQSVLKGSALGWDPRGYMASKILGLSPEKQAKDSAAKSYFEKGVERLGKEAEKYVGTQYIADLWDAYGPDNAEGVYRALETAAAPYLRTQELVERAQAQEARGEVALPEFRKNVLTEITNLQTGEVSSAAQMLFSKVSKMTEAQKLEQVPLLLQESRKKLALMKGNGEALLRERAKKIGFDSIDDIPSKDLAPYVAANMSQIEAVEGLLDAALQDPKNAQNYLMALSQNKFLASSSSLSAFNAASGLTIGQAAVSSPEGQAYYGKAIQQLFPGITGQARDDLLGQRAEVAANAANWFEARQRGGPQAGKNFIDDTPKADARMTVIKADTYITDTFSRVVKGETTNPDGSIRVAFDYFRDTNRIGNKAERPVSQQIDFLEMMNNPKVFEKLSPQTRAEIKAESRAMAEDLGAKALQSLDQSKNAIDKALPGASNLLIHPKEGGGFQLTGAFATTADGAVYVIPSEKFDPKDPKDVESFLRYNKDNPLVQTKEGMLIGMKLANKALDEMANAFNKNLVPYNRLLTTLGTPTQ